MLRFAKQSCGTLSGFLPSFGSSHSQNNPPSEMLWDVRALFFHQNGACATITKLSPREELFALLAGGF